MLILRYLIVLLKTDLMTYKLNTFKCLLDALLKMIFRAYQD